MKLKFESLFSNDSQKQGRRDPLALFLEGGRILNGESVLYAGETFSFSLGAHIDDVGAAVKLALHSNPAACSCSGCAVGACACAWT